MTLQPAQDGDIVLDTPTQTVWHRLLVKKMRWVRYFQQAVNALWREHLTFLAMAAIWLLVAYRISHVQNMEILHVGASMLLFSIPIFVTKTYTGTMRREFTLALFTREGWLYSWLSRRLLRTLDGFYLHW